MPPSPSMPCFCQPPLQTRPQAPPQVLPHLPAPPQPALHHQPLQPKPPPCISLQAATATASPKPSTALKSTPCSGNPPLPHQPPRQPIHQAAPAACACKLRSAGKRPCRCTCKPAPPCPCLPHLLWLPAAPVPHPHQQPHPAPLSKPCASACKPQARWRNPKAACALQAASKRKHKTPQHKPHKRNCKPPCTLGSHNPSPKPACNGKT